MMKIDFTQNIILENDRVLLRPLAITDFNDLLVFSVNEPELWKYSLLPADGGDNLRIYIEMALEERKLNKAYPFIVIDKVNNEVAGSTRFYDYQSVHNTLQLGYTWFGKKFQANGINGNCKLLMLAFAFEDWKIDRVEFRADYNNKKSIRAMKNIGCIEEGVLRNNCWSPGGRRDSIVLSILKDEWFGKVKRDLEKRVQNFK